ncbi:MAG TPA: phosphoglycerate dehydrogenase [Anaeromyxobacter sp.]|nr:phosphoglycerate dehydrogenase [Anaeromyxobacter sp.]
MDKVIVTPRSLSKGGHPLLERIRTAGYELSFPSPGAQPTEEQLLAAIGDAVGYLAGVERVSATVLARAAHLRVISRNGTGVDNVDLAAAEARGVIVRRAEGANARGVAELAFGHILAAVRGIASADAALKAGRWTREKGFELEGRTLGLVGCGRIGKQVARFALAFDMRVLAHDPFPDPRFSPSPAFAYAPLHDVLRQAHVLSLHAPTPADGHALLGPEAIATLRKGVVVVNTARQALVDQVAMAQALLERRVAAYTIDAFDKEPPDDLAFIQTPGVLATPHLGGFTDESVDRATAVAVDNLLDSLRGGSA